MSHEQIKQELHELIDNLDVEKALNAMFVPLYKQYFGTNDVQSSIEIIKSLLHNYQKPKEKTLEQKLIDADFKVIFEYPNETVFLKKHIEIHIHLPINQYSIYSRVEFQNVLYGESNNHNLIFADIAYLESRIKLMQ